MFLNAALITVLALPAPPTGPSVQLLARSYAGMFSELDNVWALVDCYQKRLCSGININFEKTGALGRTP